MQMVKARIASALFVLATFGLSLPAHAQRINPNRVINLHVNVESENRSFAGAVMEGQGYRITLQGVGSFEIMPVLVSAGLYAVAVHGGPENAEPEDLRPLETVNVREGVPVALRSIPTVALVIEGSRLAASTSRVQPIAFNFTSMPRSAQNRCCVTCGKVTACACAVEADCGSCCSGPCCPPEVTLEARFFPAAQRFASGRCGTPIREEERLFTPSIRTARIASRG
jgi:hypothetical protein